MPAVAQTAAPASASAPAPAPAPAPALPPPDTTTADAAAAAAAGAWFLVLAHRLQAGVNRGEPVKPLKLFLQSNNYLSAVFVALAVDSVLDLPTLLSLYGP